MSSETATRRNLGRENFRRLVVYCVHCHNRATVKRNDSESEAKQNRLGKHGGGAPDTRTKARSPAGSSFSALQSDDDGIIHDNDVETEYIERSESPAN
jgi:hypothetical protein